ncbi:MAG TPA: OmpA family protein [Steroidobacteraceae bacterium]|nr:OmpA family protein [Steroidobacteraceae bacterium]
MNSAFSKTIGAMGLLAMSTAAMADEPKPATPHEPIGFVSGAVIGAFAAGPVGAFVGAGLGTWLGNRVHRAGDATQAEAKVAALQTDKTELQTEKTALLNDKSQLTETNKSLSARLDDLTRKVETAQNTRVDGSAVLDGLQGDVLFRTGSAEITPEIVHQIQVLAQAVAKSPALKVRVDGYADPRGTVETNLKLSEDRANAVRDLFLAAGISDEALEVNAYGKSQSVAADSDGYALERRVRLTLQAQGEAAVAQVGEHAQVGEKE